MYCKYIRNGKSVRARSDGSHEYAQNRCTQEFHDLRYACITPSRPAEAKENARYGGRQRQSASMSMNGGVELGEQMKQRRNWKLCACMCECDQWRRLEISLTSSSKQNMYTCFYLHRHGISLYIICTRINNNAMLVTALRQSSNFDSTLKPPGLFQFLGPYHFSLAHTHSTMSSSN